VLEKTTSNSQGIEMKHLAKGPLEDAEQLFPPLPQPGFAAGVAEVRAMEAAQAESRQRLDALVQSLLHRAFEGEL